MQGDALPPRVCPPNARQERREEKKSVWLQEIDEGETKGRVLSIAKKAKPSQAASRVLGAQGFYAVYAILKHEACRALS
jgi:hypothetical protein